MPDPLDEYPIHQAPLSMAHMATSDRNAYDRWYFNAHDRTGDIMLVTGMGYYPNLGTKDAFVLVIDEINHLGWAHLETLRYCADELGFCVLLVGTELPDQPARDTANLLGNQLASRVGGKRIRLAPMTAKEVAGYVLRPTFGDVERPIAELFHSVSGGFWRNAVALAGTCQRIMATQGVPSLTTQVIHRARGVVGERRAAS